MSIGSKIRSLLKWIGHGYTIAQILGSLGAGTALKAYLMTRTRIPSVWITPIWLGASAIFMAVLVLLGRFTQKRKPPFIQTISLVNTGAVQLKLVEDAHNAHAGPMMQECEDSIRTEVDRRTPNDRTIFLTSCLATVIILVFFDSTWNVIWGSQVRALEFLNKGVAKVEDLIPYYSHSDKRPQQTFESWFGFLKEQILLRQDGYNVQITVRGKEFLKYLVQWGRTADDRPL